MNDFPPNSHRSKNVDENNNPDAKKKVERVTVGEVTRRKPSLGRRVASIFFGGDAKRAWVAVVSDVLVPAAKDMAADALSQGFERMIYGETRSRPRRSSFPGGFNPGSHISYNRYSSSSSVGRASGINQRDDSRTQTARLGRSTHNFDDIILATRAEAEEVVDRLFDLVSRYDAATVADLYELVGVTGAYTDEKWGWTDIRGTDVRRIRDGYLLNLPRPEPLD